MNLNLFLEQTGNSWTLKPNREYIVGSGNECHIHLPNINVVSEQHLKFAFHQSSSTWHVSDLGSTNGTFIENRRIIDYSIKSQTQIAIGGSIVLIATPEVAIAAAQPPIYKPPISPIYNPIQQNIAKSYSFPMQLLTWKEYVEQQVQQRSSLIQRIATRFYLITGFRNTPWLRGFSGYHRAVISNFNTFDGYILPDFHESADVVAIAIEEKIGQMKQYEDTDCYVARLTDAHIIDSANQSFLGIELFPIFRGRKSQPDYRKFCVVSYHRVRTYLLVENYGSDLFVSWITRFEPQPTVVTIILWFCLAIFLSLLGLAAQNWTFFLVPLIIWCEIFLLVPTLMRAMGILPKKANALLIMVLLLLSTFVLLTIFSMFMFIIGAISSRT